MAKNKSDQKRRIENVLSALKHDKLAIASLVFLVIIIALALLAPILPLDPNTTDVRNMFQPPSPEHWFGTDDIGRDYLSRVIYGGRVSLLVGFLAMITCVCVGVLVGTVSGYCGGWIDSILMRIVDIMSSIPWMVLVTVISLFLKRGLKSIIIVIGFFTWMEIARLVRAETLSLKEREYVMYAKFVGIPGYVIILKHIIPSVLPTIIIAASTGIANAIMTESSLSFLGLGIQQPMSSWGSLLREGKSSLTTAPFVATISGAFILITVLGFNLFGDGIRDVLDPKMKQ